MRHCFFILLFTAIAVFGYSQDIPPSTEQQLENLTDVDQAETEDDSFLQQIEHYRKDPINLNTTDGSELRELRLLTDLQVSNLLSYRKLFGSFLHVYELQAVPSWDIITIKKILPFVTVSAPLSFRNDFISRFRQGEHSLLLRYAQVLEKAKGFDKSGTGTKYSGGPQRLFLRHRYTFKNLLQFGFVGEKDAGEQFFKGAQRNGFDFYSFHLFARNMGIIKALAIGDFTVNMGQGLIQWQSLAFKKSVDVMGVKRQSAVLRPYNSAGEYLFNRGAGMIIRKGNIEATVFASLRKLSANVVSDTLTYEDYISSFLTSGYHRTPSEVADRNKLQQFSYGGTVKWVQNRWHIALNAVNYEFAKPVQKRDEPYNAFALEGKRWFNASADYSYTYKNIHLFGETAIDKNFSKAFLNGILVSVDPKVDLSMVHRKIEMQYQAVNGNAFTENTYPVNESGFYTGLSVRPAAGWRLDAYADIYKFPWLKSQADAPSYGKDFLAQLTYTPNRQVEIYTRFRNEAKQTNQPDNSTATNFLVMIPKQNWRTQLSYRISSAVTLRSRIEAVWYDRKRTSAEEGLLSFFDVVYRPMLKPFSAVLRLQYFETDSYNSRLYAYENDVLYSYSIPVFYDKGFRYYMTANYDLKKNISIWIRIAQTIFREKDAIGSGLDEINGNKRTEIKIQLRVLF